MPPSPPFRGTSIPTIELCISIFHEALRVGRATRIDVANDSAWIMCYRTDGMREFIFEPLKKIRRFCLAFPFFFGGGGGSFDFCC